MEITVAACYFTAPPGKSTSRTSVFSAGLLSNLPTIIPSSSIDHQMALENLRCSSPWDIITSEFISRFVMGCVLTGLPVAPMESAYGRKSDPRCSSSSCINSRVWGYSYGVIFGVIFELPIFYRLSASNAARF